MTLDEVKNLVPDQSRVITNKDISYTTTVVIPSGTQFIFYSYITLATTGITIVYGTPVDPNLQQHNRKFILTPDDINSFSVKFKVGDLVQLDVGDGHTFIGLLKVTRVDGEMLSTQVVDYRDCRFNCLKDWVNMTASQSVHQGFFRLFTPSHVGKSSDYPHQCPRCKGPAYVGFNEVDCQAKC